LYQLLIKRDEGMVKVAPRKKPLPREIQDSCQGMKIFEKEWIFNRDYSP
jgi:hypothetical protein